ncbi:MAG TPA: glycosyltransferase family 4 protein [Blastocatellia bacterium]|nr:glycosyltransferase family 4 protein [Blastocatellia bacterium]
MRIAQVSPLFESVPPRNYGGTERVVSYVTEELVKLGHEVTLFASGDSITAANLVPCSAASLRLDAGCVDHLAHHYVLLEKVFEQASEFDIIHFHIDYLHYPLSKRLRVPNITTLHGRLDLADLVPLYQHYADMPVVSISDSQRIPLPMLNWQRTVYHGLPLDLLDYSAGPGNYLAFLGRISPEKRVDRAIEIATRVGIPLRIAAKVDKADQAYYESQIKPLLNNNPLVEYIGEIGDNRKSEFLGNAISLLFPIDWPEPFGLAMIESMACGTPVVAFRRGSVPEVVEPGVTGVIVDDIEGAVRAVEEVSTLDRAMCRRAFEKRFTASRMAQDYLAAYEELIEVEIDEAGVQLEARSAVASERVAGSI